jgi:8-oxo-dGTP pyrophosphatase MutT (NUDIX family)
VDKGFVSPHGVQGIFHVLETRDWVNVIVKTNTNKYLIVNQFRFGSQKVTQEFPAGVIDQGEKPEDAALREVREECGVESQSVIKLGISYPNPAFMNNQCHHYLVEDAQVSIDQSLDEYELIDLCELSHEEIEEKIKKGTFNHSLCLSSWYLYHCYLTS